jgi:hypothetical protein
MSTRLLHLLMSLVLCSSTILHSLDPKLLLDACPTLSPNCQSFLCSALKSSAKALDLKKAGVELS